MRSSRPRRFRSREQAGDRLVGLRGTACVWLPFDVGVGVPAVGVAAVELHEADAALDQAAGEQAARPNSAGLGLRPRP